MTEAEKEEALQRIHEALNRLESLGLESPETDKYGIGWKKRDWKARKSALSGDLCLLMSDREKAEAKKQRSRPGSIGHRKAKAKVKELSRKIRKLQKEIELPYEDYDVTEPQYFKIPMSDENIQYLYERQLRCRKAQFKLCERVTYETESAIVGGMNVNFVIRRS